MENLGYGAFDTMTEKEIKEITKILEDAGWQPHLCDTPIPAYESVHAGNPEDPGQVPPEMTLVPKEFLRMYRESMVRVIGNSMIDRGIEDGDWVKMSYGGSPHDGDIVVVAIGSECTLKCYYEDDDGTRWLLSQIRVYWFQARPRLSSKSSELRRWRRECD